MGDVRMGFERTEAQTRLGDVLWDLHAAGAKVLEFTEGRAWAEYEESELLQAFCLKMLVIMTDCLRELRLKFPEESARVPGTEALVEVTETTGSAKVWRVIEESLPGVVGEAHRMLAEWHGGEAPGKAGGRGEQAEDSQERVVEEDDVRRVEYEE